MAWTRVVEVRNIQILDYFQNLAMKYSDSRGILKAELTVFADALGMGCKRQ